MKELEKQIAELRKDFQLENKERYEVIKQCNPQGVRMFEIIESLQAENQELRSAAEYGKSLALSRERENKWLNEKIDYAATVIECFQSYFNHRNKDRFLRELEEIEKVGEKFNIKETKGESNESN